MDDKLAKQLVRQLKLLNFWVSFYGIIMIAILGFVLFMVVQTVMFVQETNRRIESVKDSTNVQKRTCDANNSVSDWLKANTDICK